MRTPALVFLFSALLFSSCQKEADESAEPKTTAEKIMGKWMLVTYTEQCFKPVDQLTSSTVTEGSPGDSLIFRPGNLLFTYSDVDGNFIEEYLITNDSTLIIEFETWKIARLTEKELHLVSEETDPALAEKTIVTAVLRRP